MGSLTIYGPQPAIDDPQVTHLGMIVPVEERSEGARHPVRPAFTFDGKRATGVDAAPMIDEDGPAIGEALARHRAPWPERSRPDMLAKSA